MVDLVKRTVDRARQDEKTAKALERKSKEADARRTEQPR